MISARILLAACLLFAPCAAFAQTPAPAEPAKLPPGVNPNFMPDPGFETVTKEGWENKIGLPEGGYYRFYDPSSSKIELDDKVKREGKRSIHFKFDPHASAKAAHHSAVFIQFGGMFRTGTTYTYSAYVKTNDFHGRVGLDILQYPPPLTGASSKQQVPVTTDWMRISLSFVARPDITDIQFRMGAYTDDFTRGDVWIADLKVEEGRTPTAFVPTWEKEFYLLGAKPNQFNVEWDYEVSPEFVTPCVAPSRSTVAEKIPVLFVMHWPRLRAPVELMERADIAPSTVAINNPNKIHENCVIRMRELLKKEPKVLLMQPEIWDALLTPDRELIEKQVRDGMGLLIYNSGNPSEKMKALTAKGAAQTLPPQEQAAAINAWRLGDGMIVINYGRAEPGNTFGRENGCDCGVRALWLAARRPLGEMKLTMDPVVPTTGQPWKLKVGVVQHQAAEPAEIQVRVRATLPLTEDAAHFTPMPVIQESSAAYGGTGGIEMGGLPAGRYFIEAVALDAQKRPVAWQFMPFVTDGPVCIWSATPEAPALQAGKDLKVKVVLENDSGAEQAVTLGGALYDGNDRTVAVVNPMAITLQPGRTEKQISVAVSRSTTPMAELRLELAESDGKRNTLDQRRVSLCAEPILPEPDFRLAIYGDLGAGAYSIGADTLVEPDAPQFNCRIFQWYGYMPRPGSNHPWMKKDDDVTTPDFLSRAGARLAGELRSALPYHTIGAMLEDEWSHGTELSAQNLAYFKKWLQESYGKIDALNQSWGTNLRSFDEVTFDPCSEALIRDKKGGPVPWADLQSAMERAVYDYVAGLQKAAEAVDPDIRLGLSGTQEPAATNGLDWWLLMKVFRCMGTYGGIHDCLEESFGLPGTRIFQWSYATDGDVGRGRHDPWRDVLRQRDGYLHFGSGWDPLFLPDYRSSPAATAIAEATEAIRRGPGRLLRESSREYFGIAALFSMPSYHASGIPDQTPRLGMNDVLYSLEHLLSDSRLDPKFVSYEQLAKGQVTAKEFKVLFLPYSQALSAAEVKGVRAFAEAGGVVIADLRPATYDEHCKKLPAGALDDLFGIGPVQAGNTLATATLKPGTDYGPLPEAAVTMGESDIVSAGAKAHSLVVAKDKAAPAILVNTVGKGKAILLNFAYPDYCKYLSGGIGGEVGTEKQAKESGAVRYTIAKLLEKEAQVVPVARLLAADGTEMHGVRLYTYRDGPATYIGLNPEYSWVEGEKPFIDAKLTLAQAGELYDSREGKYLGRTDSADIKVKETFIKLFAVLPYKVDGLQLAVPAEVRAGEGIKVSAAIRADGNQRGLLMRLGRHVLVTRLQRPDGTERRWDRATWDAPQGKAEFVVPMAFNDPPGDWKLLVQDAATGVHAEAVVRVKPGE